MKVMKKHIPYLIIATLVGASVLAQNLVSKPPPTTAPAPLTVQPATDTPTIAQSVGQCAYTWAYHNADELSAMIDAEMRQLNPAASGNASFFGEDCVYADGTSTFGAMETDFYVRIPVADLTNEDALGEWLSQVLRVVLEFPRELIQGNYGFVEFWFEKSDSEQLVVRVPIQKYMDGTHGISGAALFRMFYVEP
ncbi:MAG: hypothetical protein HY864_18725 [Chloroflexi bacterium]|nr:hypothetical protein [Chloroflexota bacterium]